MVDTAPKVDKRQIVMEMFLGGKLAENLQRMKQLPDIIEQQAKAAGASDAEKRKKSFAEKIEEGVRRDLEKMERENEAARPTDGDAAGDPPQ
jgi:hypothetical protein